MIENKEQCKQAIERHNELFRQMSVLQDEIMRYRMSIAKDAGLAITSEEQANLVMERIDKLMDMDPTRDMPERDELEKLVEQLEAWEHHIYGWLFNEEE